MAIDTASLQCSFYSESQLMLTRTGTNTQESAKLYPFVAPEERAAYLSALCWPAALLVGMLDACLVAPATSRKLPGGYHSVDTTLGKF